MATRRKTARSYSNVRRVKRNNASKNVRHKLKTHRRRHRKIIMRGGGGCTAYIFRVTNSDRIYTLKYMVVQEDMGTGKKDNVFVFWPLYTNQIEIQEVLDKCIKPEKQGSIIEKLLVGQEPITKDTTSFNLKFYLKISSTNLKYVGNNYDRVSVCSFDNNTAEVIDGALISEFDRTNLTGSPDGEAMLPDFSDSKFKEQLQFQIKLNSKGFFKKSCTDQVILCKQAM